MPTRLTNTIYVFYNVFELNSEQGFEIFFDSTYWIMRRSADDYAFSTYEGGHQPIELRVWQYEFRTRIFIISCLEYIPPTVTPTIGIF